jgi:hypothetical protein
VALPPRLEKELEELRREHSINVVENGDTIFLIFPSFVLSDGFRVTAADLLLQVPRSYPDAGLDMFWLEPTVLLANGQCPQNADLIESYVNRQWRRFSWHRQGWNPAVDNLHGYLEFVRYRLRDKR